MAVCVSAVCPFMWMSNISLYGCTTFGLSIHPLIDIWGGPFGDRVNEAAVSPPVQVFMWMYACVSGSYGK